MALSDVERAAVRALRQIRRLPTEKQGAAFVLAVKVAIEGGLFDLSKTAPSERGGG